MKPYAYGILGFLMMFLCGCDDDVTPRPNPAERGRECTVLAYLIGDNQNSDLSAYLIKNFKDMVAGMEQVEASRYNLLVYIETRADLPHLIWIANAGNEVVVDTLCTYEEQNPLDVSVMTKVLTQVFDEFPADSYGLVFGSHADGWRQASQSANARAFGEYRGSKMNIADLNKALHNVGIHYEYILFDACFMQAIEVVYELRTHADYFISSPTEIPAPGAPYTAIVPGMFGKGEKVARHVAESYYNYYDDLYEGFFYRDPWKGGAAVSMVKSSNLEKLAQQTKYMLSDYFTNDVIKTNGLIAYDHSIHSWPYYYYDMDGFVCEMAGGEENIDYQKWKELYDEAVVYYRTTPLNINMYGRTFSMEGTNGLSAYIPVGTRKDNEFFKTTQWYAAAGWKQVGW